MRIELRGGVVLALIGLTTSMGCNPVGCPTGYVESMGRCLDPDGGIDGGGRDAEVGNDTGLPDASEPDGDSGPDSGCTRATFFRDADGDGHGNASESIAACAAPDGYSSSSDDCDDACASCVPGGTETCNGRNDDCDAEVDEGLTTTWYVDCDGDGFAPSAEGAVDACAAPSTGPPTCTTGAWTARRPLGGSTVDCADGNRDAYPGQPGQFAVPISGASPDVDFDYDCDGVEEVDFGVPLTCTLIAGTCTGGRWVGTETPECGDSATFQYCNSRPDCTAGSTATWRSRTQTCR